MQRTQAFTLLICLVTSACSQWQYSPLHQAEQLFFGSVAANYQWQAAMTVATEGQQNQYVIAMNSDAANAKLLLLSAQGLPLFELQQHTQEYAELRQLARQETAIISIEQLLFYLTVIYAEEQQLQSILKQQYAIVSTNSGRLLQHHSNSQAVIRIHYQGAPPWYSTAQLTDGSITLTLTSLDTQHVPSR